MKGQDGGILSEIPGFVSSSAGKESTCNAEDLVPFLGQEDLQEKTPVFMDVLGGSAGKKSAYNVGDHPWVGKIPWRRECLPTPVFWPGEFHGLYSSWGHKESDTTE